MNSLEKAGRKFVQELKKAKATSYILCAQNDSNLHISFGGNYVASLGMCDEVRRAIIKEHDKEE